MLLVRPLSVSVVRIFKTYSSGGRFPIKYLYELGTIKQFINVRNNSYLVPSCWMGFWNVLVLSEWKDEERKLTNFSVLRCIRVHIQIFCCIAIQNLLLHICLNWNGTAVHQLGVIQLYTVLPLRFLSIGSKIRIQDRYTYSEYLMFFFSVFRSFVSVHFSWQLFVSVK